MNNTLYIILYKIVRGNNSIILNNHIIDVKTDYQLLDKEKCFQLAK